jgi:hypothetical protein
MDNVPPALSPDVAGLFEPSTDTTPLSPAARMEFRKVNGELIHILPLRHDVNKVVPFLLTKGETPDKSDYLKQFHLLRYLKSSPDLGPTFSANKSDYPNGVCICSASDMAHNVHTHGRSHVAYTLTVGNETSKTAPFLSYSGIEKGVSLSPAEGEYVTHFIKNSQSSYPLQAIRSGPRTSSNCPLYHVRGQQLSYQINYCPYHPREISPHRPQTSSRTMGISNKTNHPQTSGISRHST